MRMSVWIAACGALAIWSLLAWVGHSLLDWTSEWAAINADAVSSVPAIVETVSWAFRSLGNASEIIVVIVWALGAILIIGVAGLASRFLAKRNAKFRDLKTWKG